MALSVALVAFPLLSFITLFLFGDRLSRFKVSLIGAGGIVLSFFSAISIWCQDPQLSGERQVLWTVLPSGPIFSSGLVFGFNIDGLSLVMVLVVSFVSALIALYSAEYMGRERGIARFFAVVNLFVAFMLILVLADNLWLLFLGWEGVGLASYLLIGFYFREPQAIAAAMKAFIITQVGDVFLLFGIFLCFYIFQTVDIATILSLAKTNTVADSSIITIIVLCFLGGAASKSAQLPLSTWLSDAMWGPTPVSALIHAATMVTAGVYLLARMGGLVALSVAGQTTIAVVGLSTLVMAGCCACFQTDLKRVLAYSTMSQIGYMFLAIGVQAFSAAIFHLTTHAFFKALLFLSAGVVGHACHTYDLRKLQGLQKSLPSVFVYFLIGSVSLMALPVIGSGFFSKEWIMGATLADPHIGIPAFSIATFGSFLTGLYTCRMLALLTGSTQSEKISAHYGMQMKIPLMVLAIFSLAIGWLETPPLLGDANYFSRLMSPIFANNVRPAHEGMFWLFIPTVAVIVGGGLALWRFSGLSLDRSRMASGKLIVVMQGNMGLDWLISYAIVKPYNILARMLKNDVIKASYQSFAALINDLMVIIERIHSGRLSHHLYFMMVAMVAISSVMVLS